MERALPPILVTGDQQGFTLLELMLVVLIIGLVAVSVSLALPDTAAKRLQQDARRLEAQIALATEEAIYRNSDYGLLFGERNYRFLHRRQNGWSEVEPDSRLQGGALDSETELELIVGGVHVNRANEPQILILSDGQLTPFELMLWHVGLDHGYRISASFGGDVRRLEVPAE